MNCTGENATGINPKWGYNESSSLWKLISLERKNIVENQLPVGTTVVFDDASDGLEKYAIVQHVSGGDRVFRLISKEKAGANPVRIKTRLKP
jgi:hypothetical protein